MTKTIVITSGKGGVGKTNISVNTALELSKRGCRTCLFDADFGLANVDIILGLHPEKTLNDVISGDKNLEDIILHLQTGIDIIPGSSGIEKIANLTSEKISELVSAFSQLSGYDYFLIDTSSGISKSVISFCLAGTETFVVITSESTSLIDAYSLIKVMAANGYQGTVKILVNKCPDIPTSKRTYVRFKKAVDTYLNVKIDFAGIVLLDPYVETALKSQEPVLTRFPDSVASQCIRSVVSILLSNKSLEKSSGDFGDFWKRYFDFSTADISTPKDSQDNAKASSPSSDTSPKISVEQLPQPDINENTDDKSSNVSQEVYTKKDESEESPILYQDNGRPPTISRTFPELTNLPSPLPILSKYLRLQAKGALSPSELTEIVTCDPALMVKILRVSGAGKQPRGQRLKSIRQKLQEVGPELLSTILTETSVQRALQEQSTVDTRFVNQFWYHSYKSALIARHIASAIKYPYPDEAFLAGLIHDIARLSLQTYYPELYKQFNGSLYPEDRLLVAETKAFGWHHAEMGGAALREWQLNSFISDAVKYHTESAATIETAFDLVRIVYFASRLAHLTPEKTTANIDHCISLLPLSSTQLRDCISRSEKKVEQTAAYYEIPLTSEIDTESLKKTQNDFRDLAVDYSLLQGILPSPTPTKSLFQVITRIHQGLSLLFDIQKAICLLPDKQSSSLQAVGYSECWAEEILSDISISFQSSQSFIVEAFATNTVKLVTANDPGIKLSLGDKQLLNYFASYELVCIPMVDSGKSAGVIVLGLQKNQLGKFERLQRRLEQFGVQSAKNIRATEQTAGFDETTPPLPSSTQMREIKNDLFG